MPASIFNGDYVKLLKDKLKFKLGGVIEWDHTNGCPSYPSDIAGVNNQIGQELHVRVYNPTGAVIPNGSIVYVEGVDPDGTHPAVMLAIANDYTKSRVLGMVTADIPSLGHGLVTREGIVNGLDTSAFSTGDVLFLSPTVAGGYQTAIIADGNFDVRVGHVVKDDATTGSILVAHAASHYTVETTQKTGWSNEYGPATIAFDNGTRTLTLSPVGADFHFYQAGIKYAKTTDSVVIPDTEGRYFFYYNAGVLTYLYEWTASQIESVILNNPTVAALYWNATDNVAVYLSPEFHDMQFPPIVHMYNHKAYGARYISGLGPNTIVADGSGASNAAAQFGIDAGEIVDEDISFQIPSIASTTGLEIFYLLGTTAVPTLRSLVNAGYSVSTTGTGRLAYNFLTGGNWTVAEVGNGNFVLCHVFAINENTPASRVVAVMGQAQYATVALARTGAATEIVNLNTTGAIPKEMKSIATFVFETNNTYANAVKARVRSYSTTENFLDWRATNTTGGTVAGAGSGSVFSDSAFQIFDNADPTKAVQFEASGITAATTRTLAIPNESTTIVGTGATQTLTNKTFDDAETVKQIATPSTPAAGYNKRYPKSDGIERSLLPSGKEIAIDTKGDYEFLWDKQLSDFVAYDDSGDVGYVAGLPVDGTGGSPTTITVGAVSTPINNEAGKLNIDFYKSVGSAQGEGMAVAFTTRGDVDKSAVRVCKIAVKSSANYVDNDCGIYLYDVTNSRLIYPADQNIKASSFVSAQQFEFQLSPDSTSYRLITHVQSTNATAYTLTMTVGVYESKTATGPVVTDWVSYTPTLSNSTNVTATTAKWRRVGDSIQVRGFASWGGAGAGSSLTMTLPSGFLVDTVKAPSASFDQQVNKSLWYDNGTAWKNLSSYPSTTSAIGFIEDGTANVFDGSQMAAGDYLYVVFEAAIAGWSSNQVLSEDAGNRSLSARYTSNAGTQTVVSGTPTVINFEDIDYDDVASVTIGAGWKYTAQESGKFRAGAGVRTLAGTVWDTNDYVELWLYKNGSAFGVLDRFVVFSSASSDLDPQVCGTTEINLAKGDYIDFRVLAGGLGTLTLDGSASYNFATISKNASPQQIAASEKVSAYYTSNAGQAVTTDTALVFEDKTEDTHNAYNASNGVYTSPKSGKLKLSAQYLFAATTTWAVAESVQTDFLVNGVVKERDLWYFPATVASNINAGGRIEVVGYPINKGDAIEIKSTQTSGASLNLISNAIYNSFGLTIE